MADHSPKDSVLLEYKRTHVINVATEILKRNGSLELSRSELAQAAGLTPSDIGNAFRTKADFFMALRDHIGSSK